MHTNNTTYYELPQYIGSDIIDPLVDTNGAYAAIDTAIHNVAEDVATETTDIANLQAQNGSETLTTTAQTLSGAINELDDDLNNATTGAFALIGTNTADIATINGEIGDANSGMIKDIGQLQTTVGAQGLSITSLETAVGDAESGLVHDVASLQSSVTSLETTVGDAESGLVHDVTSLQSSVSDIDTELTASDVSTEIEGVTARKYGKIVTLQISKTITGTQAGYVTIGTLPSDIKPAHDIVFAGYDNSASVYADSGAVAMVVKTTGEVQAYAYTGHLTISVRGFVSYII